MTKYRLTYRLPSMKKARAKLFQNGGSQAVRLPKECRFADLQREGKIRWVGLSNASVKQILAACEIVPIASVQNRLNPFFREAIAEGVVAHCGRNGIGFLAYSPLGGGRLNKKLPGHPVASAIARKRGVSAHAIMLAWVLAQGPSVIAIPGARTVEHVRDSATAAAIALDPEELDAIDRAEFSRA